MSTLRDDNLGEVPKTALPTLRDVADAMGPLPSWVGELPPVPEGTPLPRFPHVREMLPHADPFMCDLMEWHASLPWPGDEDEVHG